MNVDKVLENGETIKIPSSVEPFLFKFLRKENIPIIINFQTKYA